VTTAVRDLRSFLAAIGESVYRPAGALSVVHEITALQYALEQAGKRPVVHVAQPRLASGAISAIPVVCNLTASRALTARALDLPDHRDAARALAARTTKPIAPIIVDRAQAPVQAVVQSGNAVDLAVLPALTQHVMDPGPYLTAAHATTCDPDTGIDNTAIQRCWVKGPRTMSYYPYPSSHNAANLRKFWARGEDCPVVFWIGHHPAVSVATNAKLRYPESHWAVAGGVIGAPLRLVPSVTFGERIMVPADAEIVIEAVAPRDRLEADGPFGEFTGYLGPQTVAPIAQVKCITRRADAIYHDYGSGLADMLVPDNMLMEARLYALVHAVAPSLQNVHVPVSGRRMHAYLQLKDPQPGEARDALTAALAYRRVKAVVAVDADIDLIDEHAVLWAMATRVQWDRDTFQIAGLSGSSLDPSWPAGARTSSKIGIDATLPPASEASAPKPFPERSRVPAEALARASALLDGISTESWPTI
jgi:2,5-furandicarboxylate decarboxylase 1